MQSETNSLGTDNQVLGRLKAGDMSALGVLFSRHAGLMRREAKMQGVRQQDRDDVVHDTLLALVRRVAAWDPYRVDAVRFIKMVARSVAGHFVRDAARDGARVVQMTGDNEAVTSATSDSSDGAAGLLAALPGMLATLNESQRSAVQLVYLEERSHCEAGQVMGVSAHVSAMRVSRAIACLREEFKPTFS